MDHGGGFGFLKKIPTSFSLSSLFSHISLTLSLSYLAIAYSVIENEILDQLMI